MAGDDFTVHVDRLAFRLMDLQEDVAATEQHRIMVNTVRVSRVPDHVRDHNRDAYRPGLVAIGPLHAADPRLRAGERLKLSYLHDLISRAGHHRDSAAAAMDRNLAAIQGYVRVVTARGREARAMYDAEDVQELTPEDFVQMMVLDGCFIIEHLINVLMGVEEPSLHATPFGAVQLSVDLVLAENQIPFFVLVDLINATPRLPELDVMATGGYQQRTDLLMKLVQYYLAGDKGRNMEGLPAARDVCHILHLLHAMVTAARTQWEPVRLFQGSSSRALEITWASARLLQRLLLLLLVSLLYPIVPEESRWSARYGRVDVPSATDLKRMLMRFIKARGGGMDNKALAAGIMSVLGPVPLAVSLAHKDQLRLPQLRIEFRTAPLLLNLMAFEQSAEQRAGVVSAYVWFMAKLVQSPEDAGVLVSAEVVESSTSGSNDGVARFFRQVGRVSEAAGELEKSYLGEMLERLREVTSNQLLTKRADVQRYYVNVPWRLVAAFVTVVTTVASVLQTFASFKQKP